MEGGVVTSDLGDCFELVTGDTPLLISIPHAGTALPDGMAETFTEEALALPDTDWHVDRLYEFAEGLGATIIRATYSRYLIDLNRPPSGAGLYEGADNTELCPLTTFDRELIYSGGHQPGDKEINRRLDTWYEPYHEALSHELARIRSGFGYVLLYDAHSIRSRVPRFFDGVLPDFNIGTDGDRSASAGLTARVARVCEEADGFTSACNGRFTGGYITRSYGFPTSAMHAVQMELSQRTYMDEEAPYNYRDDLAVKVQPVLARVLEEMLAWGRETYGG